VRNEPRARYFTHPDGDSIAPSRLNAQPCFRHGLSSLQAGVGVAIVSRDLPVQRIPLGNPSSLGRKGKVRGATGLWEGASESLSGRGGVA
jgi:hypothetical protein